MKYKISALIVTYNIKSSELIKNINSYKKYVDNVIICDNSDKDIISNNIKKMSKKENFHYIKMNGNEGIAKGLNVGISYAIDNKADFVLTMDQDSYFKNDIITEYLKNISENAIIYSPVYIIDRKKTKKYNNSVKKLYWTMTSGNLLDVKKYQLVGKFREDFFIDGVDFEYCLRARKKGYIIVQCNNSYLIHNPGQTKIKKIFFFKYKYGYMSPMRLYYQVRNLSIIARTYKSVKPFFRIIMKLCKIILLFDNKKEFFRMFVYAIEDSKNDKMGKCVYYE